MPLALGVEVRDAPEAERKPRRCEITEALLEHSRDADAVVPRPMVPPTGR
jgi:hypothetical protein